MSQPDETLDFGSLKVEAGGITVARPVFSIVIFTREHLQSQGAALVALQKRFWDLCGSRPGWHYVNENMARHRPVTARALGMIPTWTKPGAPVREFVALELKQGEPFNAAAECMFKVLGTQPGSAAYDDGDANLVSMSFPAEWAVDRPDEMRALALEVFQSMPLVSGYAGYAFELSRYYEMGAQTHAWVHSMRHRGIDIAKPTTDSAAVARDGLKGVNWLTMLGPALAKEVRLDGQSRAGLPRDVGVEQLTTGVMITAGSRPQAGDISQRGDLTPYKSVFRLLRPLVERFASRYGAMWLMLMVSEEKTHDWIFRLERQGAGS